MWDVLAVFLCSRTNAPTLCVSAAKYSKPTIARVDSVDTLTSLSCEAHGGYPKGELRWFDEHDVPVLTTSTEEKLLSDGVFQLSSELVLPHMSNSSKYTCAVFTGNGSREDEATFGIPVVPKPEGTCSPASHLISARPSVRAWKM